MEKIKFEEPTVEILTFAAVDIITTSPTGPWEGNQDEFKLLP